MLYKMTVCSHWYRPSEKNNFRHNNHDPPTTIIYDDRNILVSLKISLLFGIKYYSRMFSEEQVILKNCPVAIYYDAAEKLRTTFSIFLPRNKWRRKFLYLLPPSSERTSSRSIFFLTKFLREKNSDHASAEITPSRGLKKTPTSTNNNTWILLRERHDHYNIKISNKCHIHQEN